jgi:hypothetical protein
MKSTIRKNKDALAQQIIFLAQDQKIGTKKSPE